MVFRQITEQWRASWRYRRTSHGVGLFRRLAWVPAASVVCHCFPHQPRSAALRERHVKHRRTPRLAARCLTTYFAWMVDNRHYPWIRYLRRWGIFGKDSIPLWSAVTSRRVRTGTCSRCRKLRSCWIRTRFVRSH